MSQAAEKSSPEGMRSVTPHLICAGALQAIDFYKKAFGAVEALKLAGPDGKLVHAALRIGDSMIMLAEENPAYGALGPKTLKGSSVTIHLMVKNADAAIAQAAAAGAKVTMPAADMFWGDRYGQIEDPYGHRWSIAHQIRDMSSAEIEKAMAVMFQ